jgi:adenosylhomocysteine nucleosidase
MNQIPTLVCFAVKQEAQFFEPPSGFDNRWLLITGMGRKNAAAALEEALAILRPSRVITAGFAGGLNPELKLGTVVFDEDMEAGFGARLLKTGALPARFHCADQVAVTTAEKQALWKSTGADAVEMESSAIRAICRVQKIPAATIRVISDAANEDLPLDFNALMTDNYRINPAKLAWKLITHPHKIPELMKFQKRISFTSDKLGHAISQSLLSDAG